MRMNMKTAVWFGLIWLLVLWMVDGLAVTQSQSSGRGQGVQKLKIAGTETTLYTGSYALVIGASEYRNGWDRLPGVKQDVSAVKETLEAQGFEVRVVLDPTREDFDRAM